MKILAIDTSGENCSASIIDETKVIADFNISTGTTHSETLLPMIDDLCKYSKIDLKDIDVFACSIGPGSFTGLRIGIATIKGFALSLDKKVIGISTLQALAQNVSNFDGLICSVLDAKNDNVYAGIYRKENGTLILNEDYQTGTIFDLMDFLKAKNENVIFVGDGSISFRTIILENLGTKAFFAPLNLVHQLSTSVAILALNKAKEGNLDSADALMPMYLKKSQAEREAESKEESSCK